MKYRRKPQVAKALGIIGVGIGTFMILIAVALGLIYNDKQGHTNVSYYPSKQITQIYFYNSNCSACKRDYPKQLVKAAWKHLQGKQILFINTKQIHSSDVLNRNMVQTYKIRKVPLIVNVDQHGKLIK